MDKINYRTLTANQFDVYADRILNLEDGLYDAKDRWDSKEDFREVFVHRGMKRVVAEQENNILGYSMGLSGMRAKDLFKDEKGMTTDKIEIVPDDAFLLWVIEVTQAFQGKGVARGLMERMNQEARAQGSQDFYMHLMNKPNETFLKNPVEIITSVEDYAGTGNTYYLSKMKVR